ncbi:unnamed protein product, partial [Iphiclides podalirius]
MGIVQSPSWPLRSGGGSCAQLDPRVGPLDPCIRGRARGRAGGRPPPLAAQPPRSVNFGTSRALSAARSLPTAYKFAARQLSAGACGPVGA